MTTLIRRPGRLFPTMVSDLFNEERLFDNDFFKWPAEMLSREEWIKNTIPAVNVTEKDKAYLIEMAVPGMNKKDFKVELEENVLTISAEKEEKKEEKVDGNTRREFYYNSFKRSFTLPVNCKAEKIESRYENGILSVEIPKLELSSPKTKKQISVL